MFKDLMKIKEIDGELKLSHKQKDFGITLSTEELIVQKPHMNYHIKLDDIVSIRPFESPRFKSISLSTGLENAREVAMMNQHRNHYQFHVKKAYVHRRSGISEIGTTSIVFPIRQKYIQRIATYGGMTGVIA
ncbi:hypothetical protein G4V62_02780 [Bacillaceae bacterium SIJ1]|uniref:hypothetical protein n=1 Tax=Litoribacterium kuwaitense TaxID=1398745 RepID=UPI0013EDC607|nr:hypothetical protein [Litoribacterium kuwaitense]NGP43925.1 hypothetical protein [Litoribacterium kuwaitense]